MSNSPAIAQWYAHAERGCWILGSVLVLLWLGALLDASHGRHIGIKQLNSIALAQTDASSSLPAGSHLWSQARVSRYLETLSLASAPPLAVLRIGTVALEVPVFPDISELHLNRGVGLIPHTQRPGVGGNLGIAGHRDGFFRVLKGVRLDDIIEVQTPQRLYSYRVVGIDIVNADNVAPLMDTSDPMVTLVTCFPFYYVGSAPQRFIVRGQLEQSSIIDSSIGRAEWP